MTTIVGLFRAVRFRMAALLCALSMLSLWTPALAADSLGGLHDGYAIDLPQSPVGNRSLTDVFKDMTDHQVSLGFQDHPVWIKIQIEPGLTHEDMVFLVITPPCHQQVTLYQTSADNHSAGVIESLPLLEKVLFSLNHKRIYSCWAGSGRTMFIF